MRNYSMLRNTMSPASLDSATLAVHYNFSRLRIASRCTLRTSCRENVHSYHIALPSSPPHTPKINIRLLLSYWYTYPLHSGSCCSWFRLPASRGSVTRPLRQLCPLPRDKLRLLILLRELLLNSPLLLHSFLVHQKPSNTHQYRRDGDAHTNTRLSASIEPRSRAIST